MNRKSSLIIRITALLLTLLLMLPALLSCAKDQDLPEGKPRLTVDEEGKLTYLVKLSAKDQQAHTGQTAYLYELLPGETVTDLNGKSAMLQNNVSNRIRFVFSMADANGGDKRCNRYVVVFSDGSVLGEPVSLSNPEALATNTRPFPNSNGIKGIAGGYESLGRTLGATHSLISLSSAELTSGSVAQLWNQEEFLINQSILDAADRQVEAAGREGMQITLELTLDSELPVARSAALINLLLARYEGGITGLILKETKPQAATEDTYPSSVKKMASVLYNAHVAMVSRAENGRVYLGAEGQIHHVQTYLQDVLTEVKQTTSSPVVGAALYPAPSTESLEPTVAEEADRNVLLSDLNSTAELLRNALGKSLRICVAGLAIPASDPSLQSALYAYAYRASQSAKADFLIYKTPVGAENGLYDADGFPRSAAECFALADTAENLIAETLASELLDEDWKALKSPRSSRVILTEQGYVNSTGNIGKLYFDFSEEGEAPQFEAIGNATAPAAVRSESWNSQVLMSQIIPASMGMQSGIRAQLTETKRMQKAQMLSVKLLPQSNGAETAEVTLFLEGTSTDGKAITLQATATLTCNQWQTVSFPVSGFAVLMDEDAPCTVSLTMKPLNASDEEATGDYHALWLHSVNLRSAAPDYSGILLIGMIVGGFLVGFSVIILFSIRKKRRHHG